MRNVHNELHGRTTVKRILNDDSILKHIRHQYQIMSILWQESAILSESFLVQWASFIEGVSSVPRTIIRDV